MYCPECGVEAADEQQYCRGCGAGLRGGHEKRSDPRATGFVMVMVMLVGLLVTMAGKFADARAVMFLGGFIVVLSAMLGVAGTYYYGVHKRRPRRSGAGARKDKLPELGMPLNADTTNKLPPVPASDHFPSVTEGTTTQLKSPAERNMGP